ncbi:MAG: hypothetical protein ACQESR_14610 [Planctomycetota bacterium]
MSGSALGCGDDTAEFFHSPAGEGYLIWGNDMNEGGAFVGRTVLEAVQKNRNKVELRMGAYRHDDEGGFLDLGAGEYSEANGINDFGDVVGVYSGNAGPGFVYLEGFGLVNLDEAVTGDPDDLAIWFDTDTNTSPQRINDSGQIAGHAYVGLVGSRQAFLLTPVSDGN